MNVRTRSRRIPLGPWGITLKMRADRAYAISRSAPYRFVAKPFLDAMGRAAIRLDSRLARVPLPDGVENTPATRKLWARVQGVHWYHTIDLGHGVVTPGGFDHRPIVNRYHLPERLNGLRVLDVASFDGFWAFELERRGARQVVALDLECAAELDLPPVVREAMINDGSNNFFGTGFRLAAEALASRVQHKTLNVYDLSPRRIDGTFDFVFCGDLLLHLMNPVKALQNIRSITRGEARFVDVFNPELDEIDGPPVLRYFGGWNLCTWWIPSRKCLVQMIKDAGFRQVEVLDTFELAEKDGSPLWRAIIRALP